MIVNTLFVTWFVLNALLLIFVTHELFLAIKSLLRENSEKIVPQISELPFVTIQLPVYNEKYVIERLLKSAQDVDYPADLIEIQVLDDSTDETSEIIKEFINNSPKGTAFKHIQRPIREGFKAGALAYGLRFCEGDFIAVFDADFIIKPDFLKHTIPYFNDEKVGVVQSKWLHINEDYSLLTRAQAIMLNTHFSVEQLGRSVSNGFINFNGTAGIWRKTCIEDAGGWHADTLTEDLDLSYRAQIKKWQFVYRFDVGSPAELPVTFEAYRTQQFRWSKGAAECVHKNMRMLWRSNCQFKQKLLGTFHLFNSSVYLLIIPLILISPIIYHLQYQGKFTFPNALELSAIGLINSGLLISIFFIGNLIGQPNKLKRILWFPPSLFIFFAMTSGISLFMLIGVLQGYFKKKSAFIRTPKFGETNELKSKIRQGYDFKKELKIRVLEAIFLCYGLFILYYSILEQSLIMGVYGLIISVGFSLAVLLTKQTFRR